MADYQNKQEALDALRALNFAVWETVLYLDTHPKDTAALQYYRENMAKYRDSLNRYEETYGALTTMGHMNPTGDWDWVEGKWPWQAMDPDTAVQSKGGK